MRPASWLGVLSAALVAGCNVPPYALDADASTAGITPADGGGADAANDGATPVDPRCGDGASCSALADTPYCDGARGVCVACLAHEHCRLGEYCTTNGACATGCRTDDDCVPAGPGGGDAGVVDAEPTKVRCDAETHTCRGCKYDDECAAGFICDGTSTCVPGCTEAHACADGKGCCGGECVDTKSNPSHCGACDQACAKPAHGNATCTAGTCGLAACDEGFGNCDLDPANGCETDLRSTVSHCGACGVACAPAYATGACEASACKVAACNPGYGDCDGDPKNGCEQGLATMTHCGACGVACTIPNGTGTCASGTCEVAECAPGFGDCDGVAANGCETDLTKDATNCGTCGKVCPSSAGTPACVSGACKYTSCAAGLGDCDGSGSCKTPITNDVANCGACGKTCSAANGTPKCDGTTCGIQSCSSGFGNCNGDVVDGCEQTLKTLAHCGACGVACTRTNASPTCSTGTCAIAACNAGYGNCDGVDGNGCETDLTSTLTHCGACGNACSLAHATAACSAGSCVVSTCAAGYGDCDGIAANGCERDTSAVHNTCSTAESLVDGSGSVNVCGTKSTETTRVENVHGTKRFKVHLVSCHGGPCKSGDPMRARIQVVSPPGMAFDLRVYTNTSCTTLVGQSTSGVPGGTETVTWSDASCPSPKDLIVEVARRSGEGCGEAKLTVTGAY